MLNPNELLASSVVANATMNRGRGFFGVNSYQRELHFDISQFLADRVRTQGQAVWYDACCGQGRALIEADREFAATEWGRKVRIIGADLVEMFVPNDAPNVQLIAANAVDFAPDCPADLITCVHGLHYLGDKLGFLQNVHVHRAPGGLFLGHLDSNNVRETGSEQPLWSRLSRQARNTGVSLQFKNHLLSLERTESLLKFAAVYVGATISPEPNYTGITVIDSWYTHSSM
jgi:SAM-dependent methyltransferase